MEAIKQPTSGFKKNWGNTGRQWVSMEKILR